MTAFSFCNMRLNLCGRYLASNLGYSVGASENAIHEDLDNHAIGKRTLRNFRGVGVLKGIFTAERNGGVGGFVEGAVKVVYIDNHGSSVKLFA